MWLHVVPFITLALGYVLGFYARKRTDKIECDERHTDGQE